MLTRTLCAAVLVLLLYSAQQPIGTASVEGVVTKAGTGEPIPGAKVTLIFVPPPAPPPRLGEAGVNMIADRFSVSGLPPTITSAAPAAAPNAAQLPLSSIPSAITDGNGAFIFRDLPAGSFRLVVASNGFVPVEYGQTNRIRPVNPIVLTAGQKLAGIAIRLTPTGNLSGRVLDLNGQPLANVPVNLYKIAFNPTGEWNPAIVATVWTNDRGEYRIFWIAPGKHYVVAGGSASLGRRINPASNDVSDNFSYAFCPQGTDIDNATSVDIRPGAEVSGCDFRLESQSLYRIQGKLVDSRTGQPPVNGSVQIASRTPIGARGSSGRVYYDSASGSFEVTDVLPGTYNLTSMLNERPTGPATSPISIGALSASTIVRVANADVRDITLFIAPSPSVSGQIISESPIPAGSRPQVRLAPTSAAVGVQQVTTVVNPDGTFTFQAGSFRTGPAEYRVTMTNVIGNSGLPVGWYVRDAKLGESDAFNTAVRLPSDAALMIYLSSKGGQVSGVVRDEKQQPVTGAQAVLIPDGNRQRTDLFQQSITDPVGRFNFPNVPPGNYKLFAWENIDTASWFDPDWLKDYEQKGVAVGVAEGVRETIDLKSIPAGGVQ